jgi:hypothetical protein
MGANELSESTEQSIKNELKDVFFIPMACSLPFCGAG